MSTFSFNELIWPPDQEWLSDLPPSPCLTIEIAAVELKVLIEHHDDFGAKAASAHDYDTELFHMARASHLRQRLAMVAPHWRTIDRKSHA